MFSYIVRRILYGVLILIGVNLLTFVLFFAVNTPDDMARLSIGGQRVSQTAIDNWKAERGYDKPLFYNAQAQGAQAFTDTIFYERSVPLLRLDFGLSDQGQDIAYQIKQRMGPSLALALPTFFLGLWVCISIALLMVFFRGSRLDFSAVVLCVVLMSISGLFYIIAGQWLFARVLRWVPFSGWVDGITGAFWSCRCWWAFCRASGRSRAFTAVCFWKRPAAIMCVRHVPRV
jgi:peptide/nickel transport system permease protein